MLYPERYVKPAILPVVTNELVIHLERFRKQYKFRDSFTISWLSQFVTHSDNLSKDISRVLKEFAVAQRGKSRHPEQFASFLQIPFPPVKIKKCSTSVSSSQYSDVECLVSTSAKSTQTLCLSSFKDSSCQTTDLLYAEMESTIRRLKDDKRRRVLELETLSQQVEEIRSSRLYKSNYALKQEILRCNSSKENLDSANATLQNTISDRQKEIDDLKRKCSNLQKDNSRLRKERDTYKVQLDESLRALNDTCQDTSQTETRVGQHNRFSDDMRVTAMALYGEAGVATSKCPMVIHLVARLLFHQELDVPHWTTVTKWVDEFNVISKVHVAEECLASKNLTLHTDATSRDKRRYVGQQLTLEDGSILSLGYTEVAVEDAQTLLESTISFFEDLCDVMDSEHDRDELFLQMIKSISSTMSDRASVMKSFNKKFLEFQRSTLGQTITTQFLYCNAHFLLGLSSACENALKIAEETLKNEMGAELGRDRSTIFSHWNSNEGATTRVIRTTADCLGPRSDEKNGCREEWLAYCRTSQIASTLTSYRSNRFNNLFANAESIILLRDDIISFLEGYVSSSNLKLKSILLDLGDPALCNCLCALALIHVHITGPYWRLVNSDTKYVDLPRYIQMLDNHLHSWSQCPEELLSPSCSGVFDGEFHSADVLPSILQDFVHSTVILKNCVEKMLEVTRRQLADFLPGGIYGGEIDDDVKACLQNCPITNLSGEHAFGDLDYDLNQRRHTSLHNRATKHMLKWNDDVSWLEKKSELEREQILALARRKKKVMKEKFRRQEELVRLKVKAKIIANQEKKLEKEHTLAKKKQSIVDVVMRDGGVCKTKQDVDRLKTAESFRAQLQYHKFVMGVKKIKVSGDKSDLADRLKTFLDTGEVIKNSNSSPPRKRRRVESGEEESSSDVSEDEDDVEAVQKFSFRGQRQGLWVAVYYDDMPYIGQIIHIQDDDNASVKFLAATKCQRDLFKWPRSDDIAVVNCTFVFMWDLDVSPVSSDGRIWRLLEYKQVEKAYSRIAQESHL